MVVRSGEGHARRMMVNLRSLRQTYPDLTLICYRRLILDLDLARDQFQRLVRAGLLVKVAQRYLEYRPGSGVCFVQLEAAVRTWITEGVDGLSGDDDLVF